MLFKSNKFIVCSYDINFIFFNVNYFTSFSHKDTPFNDKKINATINIFKASTEINDVLNEILKNLYEILDYDTGIIILSNDNEIELMALCGNGDKINLNNYLQQNNCTKLVKKIIGFGTNYYIRNLNKSKYINYMTRFQLLLYHMRSALIIPIVHKEKTYGVVIMLNQKKAAYNKSRIVNVIGYMQVYY